MNPRKKESKKWSQIPPELTKQIKTVFEENFKTQLTGKNLKVEGRIYPTEILMRIGINAKGELRFQNFEVSVDHSSEKQNTVPQIHVAVDAIASLMLEYFDNGEDHEMPYTWQEYPFEKQTIWLQFSSENSDLEAEANKLLGISDEEALLHESEEELEALGLLDDEEIDTSRPKIFRVPTDNENDTLKKKKKKEDMH
jgi:hypothetical protein